MKKYISIGRYKNTYIIWFNMLYIKRKVQNAKL